MTISKSNTVLVIVVVLAIAAASAVAAHGHQTGKANAAELSAASVADSSMAASSTSSDLAAPDPAQQVPNLDQFTGRDPFIQLTAAPAASPTPSSSPSPSPSVTPSASPLVSVHLKVRLGKRDVNETFTDCKRSDRLPPSAPALRIAAIFSDRVKFDLIDGYALVGDGGKKIFEVERTRPTLHTIKKGAATTVCSVAVLRIGDGGTGASSSEKAPLSLAATHSIEALEIGANNGVPSAGFAVDGAVYPAEEIGQTFTTDWGQIEVLGANAVAQTVTIQHADLQETLHVGRPVSQ
jgi:hypothetical protein